MKISQTQHAKALLADMHRLDERAAEWERTLDRPALEWHPPDGGWSAGQVFEHLCVANDSYLVRLRRVLNRPPRRADREVVDAAWHPSFAGRFLAKSMESPRKMPAPRMWRPAPAPRANVIAEFLGRQREIEALIERSMAGEWQQFLGRQREIEALIERSMAGEWQRTRLASPVSSLIRMNVGDAFTILVRHAERHFRQIDRLVASQSIEGIRVG
jgi:hypothetical protein